MARRKRKLYYTIEVPDKWWCYSTKKWTGNLTSNGTSTREFYHLKKALKEFNKTPKGGVIRRFLIKKNGVILDMERTNI